MNSAALIVQVYSLSLNDLKTLYNGLPRQITLLESFENKEIAKEQEEERLVEHFQLDNGESSPHNKIDNGPTDLVNKFFEKFGKGTFKHIFNYCLMFNPSIKYASVHGTLGRFFKENKISKNKNTKGSVTNYYEFISFDYDSNKSYSSLNEIVDFNDQKKEFIKEGIFAYFENNQIGTWSDIYKFCLDFVSGKKLFLTIKECRDILTNMKHYGDLKCYDGNFCKAIKEVTEEVQTKILKFEKPKSVQFYVQEFFETNSQGTFKQIHDYVQSKVNKSRSSTELAIYTLRKLGKIKNVQVGKAYGLYQKVI